MSITAMKLALEAIANSGDFLFNWHDCEPNNEREMSRYQEVSEMNEKAFTALRTAIEKAEKPKYDPIELHVLHSHIAGVLFDFMGWLTTREKRLTLSSTDEAGPAVEAITAFAKMRGLRLEDAQVEHWQTILTTPPAQEFVCSTGLCHYRKPLTAPQEKRNDTN
jgi:hypothetical protein